MKTLLKEPVPEIVPLLPLRNKTIFPLMALPLYIGRRKSISAAEISQKEGGFIILSTQLDDTVENPGLRDIYPCGVLCNILQLFRLKNGTCKSLVSGMERVRILETVTEEPCIKVRYELLNATSPEISDDELNNFRNLFERYVIFSGNLPQEMIATFQQIKDVSQLIDLAAGTISGKISVKANLQLIEETDTLKRFNSVKNLLEEELRIMEDERNLRNKSRNYKPPKTIDIPIKNAETHFHTDNNSEDDFSSENKELEEKILSLNLSEEARDKTLRELKRLKQMAPMSAEATVARSYIDWIISIPWGEYSPDVFKIDTAEEILDSGHYGMKKPKQRILEHLAVASLTHSNSGQILCLAGPPGVGKTSLATALANACNRSFVRISLGGVKDESEIRGHRRTYVGSMPGKIIQAMRRAKTCNPVILLDEIDKMSSDIKGDPASAMLEVLDPEQNHTFVDHYLDIDYDLSSVMFIATANSLDTIPWALRDRMEIIELDAYTEWDKLAISEKHLIPRQITKHGLDTYQISFLEPALKTIIHHYTREAGVRSLERQISACLRKIALEIVSGKNPGTNIRISSQIIEKWLGPHKYSFGRGEVDNPIGVVNGLAVTSSGGDLLSAEAAVIPGKGRVVLTGKLGEVMQESAQTGISWIRSQMEKLQLNIEFFDSIDIHIHFPEGAIPKDGPSAGITIVTAVLSSLLKIPVFSDTAMTGEVTLRGRVLKIGGLKEKIIAAHRSGMKRVIIPEENFSDLTDVPGRILRAMEIIRVSHVTGVLNKALDWQGNSPFGS
ncbi:endopeptidase La [Myxococcota bacterium]|nr:endopeptidase La [Myxococcota bacterium]MBU1381158.1 endopeptidase La [Myxococcota bacterium]MBU1496730.1 endopeptidase La [Myxococcota bacterium]